MWHHAASRFNKISHTLRGVGALSAVGSGVASGVESAVESAIEPGDSWSDSPFSSLGAYVLFIRVHD